MDNHEPCDKVKGIVVRGTKKQKEWMNNNGGETFNININDFQEVFDKANSKAT